MNSTIAQFQTKTKRHDPLASRYIEIAENKREQSYRKFNFGCDYLMKVRYDDSECVNNELKIASSIDSTTTWWDDYCWCIGLPKGRKTFSYPDHLSELFVLSSWSSSLWWSQSITKNWHQHSLLHQTWRSCIDEERTQYEWLLIQMFLPRFCMICGRWWCVGRNDQSCNLRGYYFHLR